MENLTTQEAAVAGGIIGGMLAIYGIILCVYLILMIIARWKVFTKAKEKGWKSIIPIYSDYIEWKIAWKKVYLFWVALGLTVVAAVLLSIGGVTFNSAGEAVLPEVLSPTYVIGALLLIPVCVLDLIATYKLFKSFGKGIGIFILYLFFPFIALLILGFGQAKYTKPQD